MKNLLTTKSSARKSDAVSGHTCKPYNSTGEHLLLITCSPYFAKKCIRKSRVVRNLVHC